MDENFLRESLPWDTSEWKVGTPQGLCYNALETLKKVAVSL
jgi:hypothetical protein